jgi:hypothetical protein
VGLSGFLYVAIVVGWAVYLVPFALKRYDEATRNRSIDRFSSAMRVLGRREAALADADGAPAVGPSAQAEMPAPGDGAARPVGSPARRQAQQQAERKAEQQAARAAARRRRRVLLTLLLATALTAAAAGVALLAWWWVAVPAGLVVLWLLACRGQARRERVARPAYPLDGSAGARPSAANGGGAAGPESATAVTGGEVALPHAHLEHPSDGHPGDDHAGEGHLGDEGLGDEHAGPATAAETAAADSVDVAQADMPADDEPTVVLEREHLAEGEDEYAGTGSLWDPVPVTLPTYVHKPRAPRTIRTIDLGTDDAPSPRRSEESAIYTHRGEPARREQPEDAETSQPEESSGPARRAVGE